MDEQENRFAALVLAAYGKLLAALRKALLTVKPINLVNVWSVVPMWEQQVTELMLDLQNIAGQGWHAAASDLGVDAVYDPTSPVLQDQLRRTRNFLVDTPNDVYTMILRVLDKHQGDPAAQTRAVENVLNISGTVNWPARAKTVAVTEVNRAFHFGSLALAMKTSGTIVKKWIAREDAATRPTHAQADNQQQNVFQPFLVGLSFLQAPSDPAGPPHEVINCRCELSYTREQ